MCTVSNIGDIYRDGWPNRHPSIPDPFKWPQSTPPTYPSVSQQEFDALKEEVKQLKKLLKAAKEYDEATGQPDCEMEDKVKFLRIIADWVGVDLDEVFGH